MSLEEYNSKRNFNETSEPSGGEDKEDIFVVQEHWASSHHFDFRIEIDGVLKSWAVPKGIPEEKGTKRLAIATEDHPLDYADFEGTIPEGEYGAGEVEIFDKGDYNLHEEKEDKITFELKGERLKGNFALIKMKGQEDNWLIFKTDDE
ncbi:MAG: DNA polymerase ligase N-terminal domain-containing protein [Candidatus Paceibacterota bacterium]